MLLAEELVLLCMDDDTGQSLLPEESIRHGVATALIFELALGGAVRRDGDQLVRSGPVPGNDHVLALAAERADGDTLASVVGDLAQQDLLRAMLVRLVSRGVLHDAELWSPGVHLPRDPHPEAAVRARLESILVHGSHPSDREGALVTLLDELQLVPLVLSHADSPAVRRRATQVANNAGTFTDERLPETRGRGWWDALDLLELLATPLRLFH